MPRHRLDCLLDYLGQFVRIPAGSDEQLLAQFVRESHEASFEALVLRHGGMVLGLCRRILRDELDAEDAFQATFWMLARKAGSIHKRDKLVNWLYRVAYHTALRAKERRARRQEQEKKLVAMRPAERVDEATGLDLRPVLDEELNRLPSVSLIFD